MRFKTVTKLAALFVLVSTSAGLAVSQPSSSVILVPDSESSVVAKPVADKLNSPVLVTGENYIPRSTMGAIREINPDQIIIISSDSSVSPEVERKLERKFEGAAIKHIEGSTEVSQQFWKKGSRGVTMVQAGQTGSELALIRNSMSSEGPVLVAENGLDQELLSEIQRLEPDQANIYASDRRMEDTLREEGIQDVKVVETKTDRSGIPGGTHIVLVIPSDTDEGLSAVASNGAEGFMITSQSDINDLVDAVNSGDVERVIVSGDSPLARTAVLTLRTRTDAEIDKEYDASSATAEAALE